MKRSTAARERIRQDSDYLTLGCFIAAILIVLLTIGFRVSYDIGLIDWEPRPASHLVL
jgi:hypothetical protein